MFLSIDIKYLNNNINIDKVKQYTNSLILNGNN